VSLGDTSVSWQGFFEVGGGLGFAVGPPIGGLLYAAGGFKLPFIAVGGAVLVFVPLTFLLVGKMGKYSHSNASYGAKSITWE